MSLTTDDDEERFARIEASMEEYRVKHQDLIDYIADAQKRSESVREQSTDRSVNARTPDRVSPKKP